MPIKKEFVTAITKAVLAHSYDADIETATTELSNEALKFNRDKLGPAICKWLAARPAGADELLCGGFFYVRTPGVSDSLKVYAPKGSKLIFDGHGYITYAGRSEPNPFPEGTPFGNAAECLQALLDAKKADERVIAATVGSFANLARLEAGWPEIWPLVPDHVKNAATVSTSRALVDLGPINARLKLPPEVKAARK